MKLRQQQQNTRTCLQVMEGRLKKTEMKQQNMMGFLARAMQNPSFMQQLVQQKEMRKELEEVIGKKRQRQIDQGPSNDVEGGGTFVKVEPEEYGDIADFEVSELDKLAIDMEGQFVSQISVEDESVERGEETASKGREFDEGFWEDLWNDGIEDEAAGFGVEGEDEENVDVPVERLGYLGSSPN